MKRMLHVFDCQFNRRMSFPTKRRRAALKRAAKRLVQGSLANRAHKAAGMTGTGASPILRKVKPEPETTVSSAHVDDKALEAQSVPLYAKNAAYALLIPGGINFLNIEDSTKWDSDIHLEESDTDPLSVNEDLIKKEPVDIIKKEKLVKEEVNLPPSLHNLPELQRQSFIKEDPNSHSCLVGQETDPSSTLLESFTGFHFLNGGDCLRSTSMLCETSFSYGNFTAHSSAESEESSPNFCRQGLQEYEQNAYVTKCAASDFNEDLFCCAICFATFHHKRTIVSHMRDHFAE